MHGKTHIKIPTLYFSVMLKLPKKKKNTTRNTPKFSKSVRGPSHIVVWLMDIIDVWLIDIVIFFAGL